MVSKTRTSGDIAIVELNGRFDSHESPKVAERLQAMFSREPTKIVINLSKTNFIDSSGLATLVQGMKRSRETGGDLRLCNLQNPVRVIFEVTRMDRAFQVFADEAAALQSFAE